MTRYSSLSEALEGKYHPADFTLPELMDMLGGKRGLVEALSDSSNTKSAAYKAAQRSVNRWEAYAAQFGPQPAGAKTKQARAISPASQEKLDQIGKEALGIKRSKITIKGTIGVNGYGPDYERKRTINTFANEEDMEELARLADEYGEDAAWEEMAEIYGVNSMYLVDGYIDFQEED